MKCCTELGSIIVMLFAKCQNDSTCSGWYSYFTRHFKISYRAMPKITPPRIYPNENWKNMASHLVTVTYDIRCVFKMKCMGHSYKGADRIGPILWHLCKWFNMNITWTYWKAYLQNAPPDKCWLGTTLPISTVFWYELNLPYCSNLHSLQDCFQ